MSCIVSDIRPVDYSRFIPVDVNFKRNGRIVRSATHLVDIERSQIIECTPDLSSCKSVSANGVICKIVQVNTIVNHSVIDVCFDEYIRAHSNATLGDYSLLFSTATERGIRVPIHM